MDHTSEKKVSQGAREKLRCACQKSPVHCVMSPVVLNGDLLTHVHLRATLLTMVHIDDYKNLDSMADKARALRERMVDGAAGTDTDISHKEGGVVVTRVLRFVRGFLADDARAQDDDVHGSLSVPLSRDPSELSGVDSDSTCGKDAAGEELSENQYEN